MEKQIEIPEFSEEDKRDSKFFDFDKQNEVVGILLGVSTGVYGDQYVIKTLEQGEINIGTYGVLSSKIRLGDVGKYIKIIYRGEEVSPKTKRIYKNFEVYIK